MSLCSLQGTRRCFGSKAIAFSPPASSKCERTNESPSLKIRRFASPASTSPTQVSKVGLVEIGLLKPLESSNRQLHLRSRVEERPTEANSPQPRSSRAASNRGRSPGLGLRPHGPRLPRTSRQTRGGPRRQFGATRVPGRRHSDARYPLANSRKYTFYACPSHFSRLFLISQHRSLRRQGYCTTELKNTLSESVTRRNKKGKKMPEEFASRKSCVSYESFF